MSINFCNNLKNKGKIAVIGMGFVGGGIVHSLMLKNIADTIILIDKREEAVNAELLDIRTGISEVSKTKVIAGSYKDISDCDLIIVTAGRNRKHDETRLDLIDDNIKVADEVVAELKKYYKQGIILVVTNPVDIITYYISQKMDLPLGKVIGTGCILDTSRFIGLISEFTGECVENIEATVIGEHGTGQIHLWSSVKINDLPIEQYCKEKNIEFNDKIKNSLSEKVLNMGSEIILGKGKTHYGISSCVCHLADAILNNKKIISSVTAIRNGEYGIFDTALSLPSEIDSNGLINTISIKLDEKEKQMLVNTAEILSSISKKYKSGENRIK